MCSTQSPRPKMPKVYSFLLVPLLPYRRPKGLSTSSGTRIRTLAYTYLSALKSVFLMFLNSLCLATAILLKSTVARFLQVCSSSCQFRIIPQRNHNPPVKFATRPLLRHVNPSRFYCANHGTERGRGCRMLRIS